PRARFDEFEAPLLAIGFYDVVLAFDHLAERAWIISQGWPESEPDRRRPRAIERLEQVRGWLSGEGYSSRSVVRTRQDGLGIQHEGSSRRSVTSSLPASHIRATYDLDGAIPQLTSSFTREQYLAALAQAIEYIRAGDIFQVNLAQRLL